MILRLCVVIPSFNDARTISEVVKDVVTTTPFPVLIVDDGSETPVSNALYSWEVRQALEEGRVRVLRFEKNEGKGAALRAAINELVERGFTHMLTMDATGYYSAREILKLNEVGKKNPWDLILGNRGLKNDEAIGFVARWKRKFASFWVKYETGSQIKDPQSGFRVYPLFPLQTMDFFTRHYDFDIEVLIRLMWRGIAVQEIDIVRTEEEIWEPARVHKFWDGLRISVLNLCLVVLSLFRTHREPLQLSLAMGLGVFIGCTPFYGVHFLIAIALALVLRLNVVVMWIGTHISTPLLAPFVVMSEIWVGRHWLHVGPENSAKEDFLQWLAGSGVVGVILGVGIGLLTLAVSWYVQKRRPSPARTSPVRGNLGLLRLVLRWFGLKGGYRFSWLAVPYHYLVGARARRAMNEYWKLLEPSETWWPRQKRVLAQLQCYGRIVVDRELQNLGREKAFVVAQTGKDHVSTDAMLLSANLGSWRMTAELLNLHHDCLLGDGLVEGEWELIPFLGKLAPFDVSPFRLAAERRVGIVVSFGVKGEKNSYEFYARVTKYYKFIEGESRESQILAWARDYVRDLEQFARRHSDQWFNFFPFWSAVPSSRNSKNLFAEELGRAGEFKTDFPSQTL